MKKFVKMIGFTFTFVLALVMGVTSASADSIKFDINKDLTSDDISNRFQEINTSYQTGEAFSEEDTEFIKIYADKATSANNTEQNFDYGISTTSIKFSPDGNISESFSKSKTKYNTTVKFSGKLYSDVNIINHSYRGDMTAKITSGASKVSKLKLVVTNVAYGVLGNEGTYIGIVNDSSTSASSSKTTFSMDKTKKYSAIGVVYTHTDAYVEVNTSSGNYSLYAF